VASSTQFFLYGDTPVKLEPTPQGGMRVSFFDVHSGSFRLEATFWSRIFHDRDGMARKVARQEFDRQITRLQNRELTRRMQHAAGLSAQR